MTCANYISCVGVQTGGECVDDTSGVWCASNIVYSMCVVGDVYHC